MPQYSEEQLEAADVRTRAYMRDINRLDDESKAYARALWEIAAEIDMLAGRGSTIGPSNAKDVARRAMEAIRAQLAASEARVKALEGLLHRVYGEALVYNEDRGWHECRRCHGQLAEGGVQHRPQCAWAAVEEALNIERGPAHDTP